MSHFTLSQLITQYEDLLDKTNSTKAIVQEYKQVLLDAEAVPVYGSVIPTTLPDLAKSAHKLREKIIGFGHRELGQDPDCFTMRVDHAYAYRFADEYRERKTAIAHILGHGLVVTNSLLETVVNAMRKGDKDPLTNNPNGKIKLSGTYHLPDRLVTDNSPKYVKGQAHLPSPNEQFRQMMSQYHRLIQSEAPNRTFFCDGQSVHGGMAKAIEILEESGYPKQMIALIEKTQNTGSCRYSGYKDLRPLLIDAVMEVPKITDLMSNIHRPTLDAACEIVLSELEDAMNALPEEDKRFLLKDGKIRHWTAEEGLTHLMNQTDADTGLGWPFFTGGGSLKKKARAGEEWEFTNAWDTTLSIANLILKGEVPPDSIPLQVLKRAQHGKRREVIQEDGSIHIEEVPKIRVVKADAKPSVVAGACFHSPRQKIWSKHKHQQFGWSSPEKFDESGFLLNELKKSTVALGLDYNQYDFRELLVRVYFYHNFLWRAYYDQEYAKEMMRWFAMQHLESPTIMEDMRLMWFKGRGKLESGRVDTNVGEPNRIATYYSLATIIGRQIGRELDGEELMCLMKAIKDSFTIVVCGDDNVTFLSDESPINAFMSKFDLAVNWEEVVTLENLADAMATLGMLISTEAAKVTYSTKTKGQFMGDHWDPDCRIISFLSRYAVSIVGEHPHEERFCGSITRAMRNAMSCEYSDLNHDFLNKLEVTPWWKPGVTQAEKIPLMALSRDSEVVHAVMLRYVSVLSSLEFNKHDAMSKVLRWCLCNTPHGMVPHNLLRATTLMKYLRKDDKAVSQGVSLLERWGFLWYLITEVYATIPDEEMVHKPFPVQKEWTIDTMVKAAKHSVSLFKGNIERELPFKTALEGKPRANEIIASLSAQLDIDSEGFPTEEIPDTIPPRSVKLPDLGDLLLRLSGFSAGVGEDWKFLFCANDQTELDVVSTQGKTEEKKPHKRRRRSRRKNRKNQAVQSNEKDKSPELEKGDLSEHNPEETEGIKPKVCAPVERPEGTRDCSESPLQLTLDLWQPRRN